MTLQEGDNEIKLNNEVNNICSAGIKPEISYLISASITMIINKAYICTDQDNFMHIGIEHIYIIIS